MAHQFTDDDRGKPVVTNDGEQIGTVADVSDGAATFEADKDLPGPLREALDVDDGMKSTMQNEQISTVTSDEVRLKKL
jgi:hypothetical protein